MKYIYTVLVSLVALISFGTVQPMASRGIGMLSRASSALVNRASGALVKHQVGKTHYEALRAAVLSSASAARVHKLDELRHDYCKRIDPFVCISESLVNTSLLAGMTASAMGYSGMAVTAMMLPGVCAFASAELMIFRHQAAFRDAQNQYKKLQALQNNPFKK